MLEKHFSSSRGFPNNFITEDKFELSSSIVDPLAHFFWLEYKKCSKSDLPSLLQWASLDAFNAAMSNGKFLNSIFIIPVSINSFFGYDLISTLKCIPLTGKIKK